MKTVGYKLQILATNFCNLECPWCCQGFITKTKDPWYISFETLKKISTLIYPVSTILIVGGEPTLHPDFEKLSGTLSLLFPDAYLSLATNGTWGKGITGFNHVEINPILLGRKNPRDPMIQGSGIRHPSKCHEMGYFSIENDYIYPCCSVGALTRLRAIDKKLLGTDLSPGWESRFPDISEFCKLCSVDTLRS